MVLVILLFFILSFHFSVLCSCCKYRKCQRKYVLYCFLKLNWVIHLKACVHALFQCFGRVLPCHCSGNHHRTPLKVIAKKCCFSNKQDFAQSLTCLWTELIPQTVEIRPQIHGHGLPSRNKPDSPTTLDLSFALPQVQLKIDAWNLNRCLILVWWDWILKRMENIKFHQPSFYTIINQSNILSGFLNRNCKM
jgi:hypothetical protein